MLAGVQRVQGLVRLLKSRIQMCRPMGGIFSAMLAPAALFSLGHWSAWTTPVPGRCCECCYLGRSQRQFFLCVAWVTLLVSYVLVMWYVSMAFTS